MNPDDGPERPDADGPLSLEPDDKARWAHREDPDLRAERETGKPAVPPPARPTNTSRYGWLVGVAFLLAVAYVGFNGLRTQGVGSTGIDADRPLPPFAVPLALSDLDGDANIARTEGGGDEGRVPACAVTDPRALNLCTLARQGPVVLAFRFPRGAGEPCDQQLDSMESVRRKFRGVGFAAVSVRGDRDDLRRLVRERGWGFPVGYDRDGLVSNLYGVAVCPTVTLAYPGGIVRETTVGLLDERQLTREVAALVATSRARGWTPEGVAEPR